MAELCITVGSARYLVNPGSVGQPRDGDPRAAFALVDLDGGAATVRFCRVAFDRDACQAKVARAGISDGGRLGDLRTGRRRVP
jgi:diadenosine tetraphosphatase ApaH/serine/threonine PP2A family protein phosphatase